MTLEVCLSRLGEVQVPFARIQQNYRDALTGLGFRPPERLLLLQLAPLAAARAFAAGNISSDPVRVSRYSGSLLALAGVNEEKLSGALAAYRDLLLAAIGKLPERDR